jgi:hypothetical protein
VEAQTCEVGMTLMPFNFKVLKWSLENGFFCHFWNQVLCVSCNCCCLNRSAAEMKPVEAVTVCRDVTPCSLLDMYQCFWDNCCLHLLVLPPWRWRQWAPPRRWYLLTGPHGITSQKTVSWASLLWEPQVSLLYTFQFSYHTVWCYISCAFENQLIWMC